MATATAVALVVDSARMPVYLVTQSNDLIALWQAIAVATVGVVIGTVLGNRVLGRIPESWFRRIFAVILAVLGGAMLVRGLRP